MLDTLRTIVRCPDCKVKLVDKDRNELLGSWIDGKGDVLK